VPLRREREPAILRRIAQTDRLRVLGYSSASASR
jgi:hypothetical protein